MLAMWRYSRAQIDAAIAPLYSMLDSTDDVRFTAHLLNCLLAYDDVNVESAVIEYFETASSTLSRAAIDERRSPSVNDASRLLLFIWISFLIFIPTPDTAKPSIHCSIHDIQQRYRSLSQRSFIDFQPATPVYCGLWNRSVAKRQRRPIICCFDGANLRMNKSMRLRAEEAHAVELP